MDIGNTYLKATVFSDRNIVHKYKYRYNETNKFLDLVNSKDFEKIFFSSKNLNSEFIKKIKSSKVFFFNKKLKIPLEINYNNIHSLGNDRIFNLVGAKKEFPNKNLIIIDAGTCITMDILSSDGLFVGGRISQGLNMRYKSISQIKELPLLNYQYTNSIYGNCTDSSIHVSVQRSIISEINDFKFKLEKQFNNVQIVLTGGDMFFLLKELKNTIFAEENLVAIGMNEIMLLNEI